MEGWLQQLDLVKQDPSPRAMEGKNNVAQRGRDQVHPLIDLFSIAMTSITVNKAGASGDPERIWILAAVLHRRCRPT